LAADANLCEAKAYTEEAALFAYFSVDEILIRIKLF